MTRTKRSPGRLLFEVLHSFEIGFGWTVGNVKIVKRLDAGTDWDLATDDDVFLETMEVIDATIDGGVDKHASGILEGRSGQEGVGPDGNLSNTEEEMFEGGWFATSCFELSILVFGGSTADDVTSDE